MVKKGGKCIPPQLTCAPPPLTVRKNSSTVCSSVSCHIFNTTFNKMLFICILALVFSYIHGDSSSSCTIIEVLPPLKPRIYTTKSLLIRIALHRSSIPLLESISHESSLESSLESVHTLKQLLITTFPPLIQNIDFQVYSYTKENIIPSRFRHKNRRVYIGLKLLPGKSWVSVSSRNATALYITGMYVCMTQL